MKNSSVCGLNGYDVLSRGPIVGSPVTPRNGRRALQGETCSLPSENALIPSPLVRCGGTALLRCKCYDGYDISLMPTMAWWGTACCRDIDALLDQPHTRRWDWGKCAVASRKIYFLLPSRKIYIFCCLRVHVAPVTLPLPVRHPRAVDTQDAYIKQSPRAMRGGRLGRLDRCGYASA